MSEYQYYEFLAIDRPLTEKELDAVRATSTRARITRTSFVNEYQWGNFKGDPDRMVENYFDAFLYTSNFRHQRFLFRVPSGAVDADDLAAYSVGEVLSIRATREHVFVDFDTNLDEINRDSAADGEGWMSSLIPIREEVLSGDHRGLYLG